MEDFEIVVISLYFESPCPITSSTQDVLIASENPLSLSTPNKDQGTGELPQLLSIPWPGGPPITAPSSMLCRWHPDHLPRRAVWGWVLGCLPLEMDLEGGRSLASVGERRRLCPRISRKQPTSIFSIFKRKRCKAVTNTTGDGGKVSFLGLPEL